MTHDELLAEIDVELNGSMYTSWNEGAAALRAVVQLHRPVGDMCLHCGEDAYYPCQTIQVIEKEINA